MSARNLLLVFVFIFIAAAAFGAAYLFFWPDEQTFPPAATTKKPSNVPEAEAALRNAETTRDNLKRAAQEAKDDVEGAKREADKLEDTARRNNIDFTKPETRTAQARAAEQRAERAAEQLDAQVKNAEEKVRLAKANLDDAKNVAQDASKNTAPAGENKPAVDSGRDSVQQPKTDKQITGELSGGSYALLIAAATTSTLALCLVVLLLLWSWNATKKVNATTEQFANIIISRQTDAFESVNKVVNNLKDIYGKLSKLDTNVGQIQAAIENDRLEQAARRRLAASQNDAQPTPRPNYDVPDSRYNPAPIEFPITANRFLSSVGGSQQIIKPDPLRNLLVRDPDGRGQLVLVSDGGVSGGQLYIIPRLARFQTMQDFYNHYEQFYDCNDPTDGEVWVNKPAVVYDVDGGWQLSRKGILEVKK